MVLCGPLFHEFAQLLIESCLVTGSSACGKLRSEMFVHSISLFLSPAIAGPCPCCMGASWCRDRRGWMPGGSWSMLGTRVSGQNKESSAQAVEHVVELRVGGNGCCVDRS